MADISKIEVDGLIELKARLERLIHFDPSLEQRVQKVIDQSLVAVRRGVIADATSAMKSDPNEAAKAVRRSVYKKILGGQVNILQKRKAGNLRELPDSNAKQYWRRRGYVTGMNKRYQKSDRGFILRFANAGTKDRVSPTMDNHPMYRKSTMERPAHRPGLNDTMLKKGRKRNGTLGLW